MPHPDLSRLYDEFPRQTDRPGRGILIQDPPCTISQIRYLESHALRYLDDHAVYTRFPQRSYVVFELYTRGFHESRMRVDSLKTHVS